MGIGAAAIACRRIAGRRHARLPADQPAHETAFIEQNYAAVAAEHGKAAAEAILPALSVRESFLMTGLDQLRQDFGSVARYLGQGLGLNEATQDRLRTRLLA
nr:tyrosine-protein phosphatase [Kerstersia gyiorum]